MAKGTVNVGPVNVDHSNYAQKDLSNVTNATVTGKVSAATQSAAGLLSAADKKKLDGIATGATKITIDSALSSTSTNPVQNKVVNEAMNGKMSSSGGNMGGELVFNTSDGGVQLANPNANSRKGYIKQFANGEIEIKNHVGSGNDFTALQLKPEGYNGVNFLRALRMSGGVQTGYDVLHTGNIADHAALASHNQAASTITAGTLGGQVVANASAVSTVGTKQVRNIYAGTEDMTAGTTTLASGDIYIVYE